MGSVATEPCKEGYESAAAGKGYAVVHVVRSGDNMDGSRSFPPAVAHDVARVMEAMTDAHLGVMVDIVGLERAAATALEGRAGVVVGRVVRDLCALRDAAAGIVIDATQPAVLPLFQRGAPLGVYMTGLLVWSRSVTRAMRRLVRSTQAGQPEWLPTRRRLDAAKATHLAGLVDDVLSHAEELCRAEPAAPSWSRFSGSSGSSSERPRVSAGHSGSPSRSSPPRSALA